MCISNISITRHTLSKNSEMARIELEIDINIQHQISLRTSCLIRVAFSK